jgi:hypothetical protein
MVVKQLPGERLNQQRQKLLDLVRANPKASRSELQILSGSILCWLRRHDKEWLEAHLPPSRKRIHRFKTVDWGSRDRDAAKIVERVASCIREISDPPLRVSKTEIIKRLDLGASFDWTIRKLPLTTKALEQCVESVEDFLLRRIELVTECCRKEGITPMRSVLCNLSF